MIQHVTTIFILTCTERHPSFSSSSRRTRSNWTGSKHHP